MYTFARVLNRLKTHERSNVSVGVINKRDNNNEMYLCHDAYRIVSKMDLIMIFIASVVVSFDFG